MALEGGLGDQAKQMEVKPFIHPFGKYLSSVSHVPGTMEALVPSGEQARVMNLEHNGLRGTLYTELGVPVPSAAFASHFSQEARAPNFSLVRTLQSLFCLVNTPQVIEILGVQVTCIQWPHLTPGMPVGSI